MMNIPENLRYTENHEWIRKDGNKVFVGITDYAQGELGDIVFIEIETEGEKLLKGVTFGTIQAVKTVSDLFWMIIIEMENLQEIDGLLTPEQYRALISA